MIRDYRIITAGSVADLQREVVSFLNRDSDGSWEPLGSPFTEPYSPGHGHVVAMPDTGQSPTSGWIFVNFCQAMVRR